MSASQHDHRPLAQGNRQVENERVVITEWRFSPGAHTGWHRHEMDYVVVPLTSGKLLIASAAGESHAELSAGISYARQLGVEHDVINDNPFDFAFIEIELKP